MEEEKHRLFGRYLKGQLSENERRLLEDFYELESQRVQEWNTDLMGEKDVVKKRIKPQLSSPRSIQSPRISWANIAAVSLLMLAFTYIFYGYEWGTLNSKGEIVQKSTSYGQTSQIHLEDGTTVWLNAGSTLSYPKQFTGETRKVDLIGEAFFEVSKDQRRPFIVSTPHLSTTVLGTTFNISAYDSEPEFITVSRGKVLVQKTTAPAHTAGQNERILYANDQVLLTHPKDSLIYNQVNAGNFSSWRQGEYHLDNMTIKQLTRMLERRFGVVFIFHDQGLQDCALSGEVRKMPLSEWMELLATTLEITYKIRGRKIYLYGHPC